MSRSRKKTPVTGIAICDSEKQDKVRAHRKLRAAVRGALANDNEIMPGLREVSNVWTFGKDGKQWLGKRYPELSRK